MRQEGNLTPDHLPLKTPYSTKIPCVQAVDPAEAATVSSAELALCNISELFMLGIAAVLSDPSFFGLLINISVTAVAGAAAVFTAWALGERVGRVAGGSLMPPGHGAAAA